MKKKILFVDDEENILQGLKRLLRRQRSEWDMAFAISGADALEMLEKDDYDAVVTDMRMPGMNGSELLEAVKLKHPDLVRFILSGHSDQELVMRSVGPSHQYLAKPCDVDILKAKLDKAFALRELLSSEALRTLISHMTSLPSLPGIYRAVVEELQSEDASIKAIGDLIEQDPGMATKILQLVNSAYFGMPRQISSPVEAANLLGLDIIKALVLSEGVFSQFDDSTLQGLSVDTMRARSLKIASISKDIATSEGASAEVADQSYLSGLLSEFGALVLASNMPEQYQQVIALARQDGVLPCAAERQVFGTSRAEVGAYVLGLWGIDDDVVTAIACQDDPATVPFDGFNALTALVIARSLYESNGGECPYCEKIEQYIEQLGLAERMESWKETCRTVMEDAA